MRERTFKSLVWRSSALRVLSKKEMMRSDFFPFAKTRQAPGGYRTKTGGQSLALLLFGLVLQRQAGRERLWGLCFGAWVESVWF